MGSTPAEKSPSWLLRQSGTRAVRDGVIISVMAVVLYILCEAFNLGRVAYWFYEHQNGQIDEIITVLLFLLFASMVFAWRRRGEFLEQTRQRLIAETERAELIPRLEEALSEVKVLTGLLPICAWCKKIRDDTGYWDQIESYIQSRTDAKFTHGICPDCARNLQTQHEELMARRAAGKAG